MTIGELRALLRRRLRDEVAVRVVLEEVTGSRYAGVLAAMDATISATQLERALGFVVAIERGDPIQHAIGHWSFRELELRVDRRALIPRPETELLVEVVLDEMRARVVSEPVRCLDLGTGTGAIALSIIREWPSASVVATDLDDAALSLATDNAALLSDEERGRLTLLRGSWFEALEPLAPIARVFDVICANPPYLSTTEWADVDEIVRDNDPRVALVGGEVGTEQITQILRAAPAYLREGALVAMEIGWTQGAAAVGIATAAGASDVRVLPDLAGRDRLLLARF